MGLLLGGCASTTSSSGASKPPVGVESGKARLVLTRNTDAQYFAVNARVDLNGERVAELSRGQSFITNVNPGKINFSLDAWGWSGRYLTSVNLEADKTYVYEVGPRSGSLGTALAFGAIGTAVDAALNENTGPFSAELKQISSTK